MEIGTNKRIKMEQFWKEHLISEFSQEYMQTLREFLKHEKRLGKTIYPESKLIFSALNLTPFIKSKLLY